LREDAVVYQSMVENFEYLWEFYFPSLLLFALSYPRENRILRGFAFSGFILYLPYMAHLITIMLGEGLLRDVFDAARHLPLEKDVSFGERTVSLSGVGNVISAILGTLVKLHKQLFLLVNVVYAAVALYFISSSLKRQLNPRISRQLKTVLAGLGVSTLGYVLAKVASPVVSDNVSLALVNFALITGGGAVAYAVVKLQFLGIRFVARKSLLYGAAAVLFAAVYLLVVKPVSDYFGRYSVAGKDAFETGFIILAIIAFQPTLLRVEELLERLLLKGRDDLQVRFKNLAGKISTAGSEEELEGLLRAELEAVLDASSVKMVLVGDDARTGRLAAMLERLGEPVVKRDFFKLAEKGGVLDPEEETGEAPDDSRKARANRRAAAAALLGADEVLVPVFRERRCVAFVSIGEKTYGLRYTTEELAQLSVISNQIGVALDNIRLLRENVEKKLLEGELEIARRIQSQLLPARSPRISGYDLSAATVPSRYVGGDYYDFDLIDDRTLTLVVADVSGKGIPASLLMATLRAAVNSNLDARKAPAEMLRRINTLLYESTSPEEFATVFYAVVDLERGMMKYANAGHEFPFLVVGKEVRQLGESGMVIGCVENYPYEESSCEIPSGGMLVLYTDGITDATSTEENYGEGRLRDALEQNGRRNSQDLCADILADVQRFAAGGEQLDDLTLVVLKRE
jgi:serine phosphatase RsbU (regulator of sigma subunit)